MKVPASEQASQDRKCNHVMTQHTSPSPPCTLVNANMCMDLSSESRRGRQG